eukprot:gene36971-57561_t
MTRAFAVTLLIRGASAAHVVSKGRTGGSCTEAGGCATQCADDAQTYPSDLWPSATNGCRWLNYADAATFCQSQGARLCTDAEFAVNCVRATGCNFDSRLVWTSSTTGCATPPPTASPTTRAPSEHQEFTSYFVEKGNPRSNNCNEQNGDCTRRCADPAELHPVRCCSSTLISGWTQRSDAVCAG